ncbi:MAG: MFS transporter [Novosphingobium sp.]
MAQSQLTAGQEWSRTQISLGMSLGAIITVIGSPFAGMLIDRWGSRRLALPGLVLTAASIAAFGLSTGSIALWIGLWLIFGFISMSVKTTVWSTAVAGLFDASRGLALGVTLSGTAATPVNVAAMMISGALIFSLGRYPDWTATAELTPRR